MLSLQAIQMMVGGVTLLDQASFTLHPGQKVGLVGKNGAGKSTLFKAILGEQPIEQGTIELPQSWQLGYVEQEIEQVDLQSIDYVVSGDSVYAGIQQQIQQATVSENHEQLVHAYDELDKIQGYEVPMKAQQLLYGLGFSEADLSKPVSAFSGGWQVRLKLAKALMQRADLMLLDEPTNHLDIEAVSWLIQWLAAYDGAVVVISHDRYFLDEVVKGILSIDQAKLHFYAGNFAAYERQKNAQLMQQQALHDKQKQHMQHLKTFIERFKAKASKAKQAQSRVKALSRIEEVSAVQATNPFKFTFYQPDQLPDPMLTTDDLSFSYDATGDAPEIKILKQVDLVLRAGDRIGLVGINGSGKSTLLKLMVDELKPLSGKVIKSRGVQFGYFAQHQLSSLNLDWSPLKHLLALNEAFPTTDQEARDFLGQFGFSNEKVLSAVKHFSGGEKARLSLAIMIHQKPNLIILDEPTNHLDMETRDALEMALQAFQGALILVSHDQHLLSSIVDQYWWVHEGKVSHLHGSLEDYLSERLKLIKQQKIEQKALKNTPPPEQNKKQLRQQNAEQRKAVQQATRAKSKQLSQLEKQLEKAEARLNEIHVFMEDEQLYASENAARLTELLKEEASLKQRMDEVEASWLSLEEEIEAIKAEFE